MTRRCQVSNFKSELKKIKSRFAKMNRDFKSNMNRDFKLPLYYLISIMMALISAPPVPVHASARVHDSSSPGDAGHWQCVRACMIQVHRPPLPVRARIQVLLPLAVHTRIRPGRPRERGPPRALSLSSTAVTAVTGGTADAADAAATAPRGMATAKVARRPARLLRAGPQAVRTPPSFARGAADAAMTPPSLSGAADVALPLDP